jgi:SAM-dependent methyltransferase
MPDLDWNRITWNDEYPWTQAGEEWSACWGNSEAQWMGSILPRVHRFLPCRSVLEIAPGFGRWTRFLLRACDSYVGLDVARTCVERCQERFRAVPHARFVENDGRTLAAVPDGSVDFAFSFDSLVHVELEVLRSYLEQLVSKASPTGVAFIHHSNAHAADAEEARRHHRALDVSAERVQEVIRAARGKVLVQEEVNWGATSLIDAFTLFASSGAQARGRPVLLKNAKFMLEAQLIKENLSPYSPLS